MRKNFSNLFKNAGFAGSEVFKVGEKVEIYHFSDINSNVSIPALNVFFANEAKVEAFQKQEGSAPRQGKM